MPQSRSNHIHALAAAAVAAASLVGCGSSSHAVSERSTPASSSTQGTTTAENPTTASTAQAPPPKARKEKLPVVDLPVTVPSHSGNLPFLYTCDGANTSLPLRWGQVPPDTREIDVFVFQTLPVSGKLVAAWALAGLKPSLRTISAGQAPTGAVVGLNHDHRAAYSLCPPKGESVNYVAMVVPLAQRIPAKSGFDAENLVNKAVTIANVEGRASFNYKRR